MSSVLAGKYPASEHALNVILELAKLVPEDQLGKVHGIFLQAPPTPYRFDTDRELSFHQEANFTYLTGLSLPNPSVFIRFLIPDRRPTPEAIDMSHQLFIPAADPAETMWSVPPPTLEHVQSTCDTDKVAYLDDLREVIKKAIDSAAGDFVLHTLPITMEYPALPPVIRTAVGMDEPNAEGAIRHETGYLLEALQRARMIKDEYEISLIREANRIASAAHEVVMRELGASASARQKTGQDGDVVKERERDVKMRPKDWELEGEGDAEALFVASCRRAGAIHQAYLPIVASGTRASTLHYVCNDRLFPSLAQPRHPNDHSFHPPPLARGCCGTLAPPHEHATPPISLHDGAFEPQVLLIDAGCEWRDYASDITRVMPVGNGGKFTKEAGDIYELVLKMQKECEAMVKPLIHWDTLHLHAHRVLVAGFQSLGIFKSSADQETILQSGLTAAFFPHGLGHALGLDVHDSRQYLASTHIDLPKSSTDTPAKLYKYLRIRQPLRERMVLTVEPGCYFAPQLMEEHGVWESEHVNVEVLKRYVGTGGVRIEDVVVVREGGCENLTTVGRERAWVEGVCSGSL